MRAKTIVKVSLVCCGWFIAAAANAAAVQTWTFNTSTCLTNCSSSSQFRQYKSDLGGVVSVQALYTTNSNLNNNLQARQSGSSATVTTQDPNGVGITNPVSGDSETSSPNHAIDNISNRDFLLLDFGEVMDLTSFSIGWKGSDSDMSFLYAPLNWDMTQAANQLYNPSTGQQNGTSINDLIASSWTPQNYNDVATNTGTNFVNGTYTTPVKSRYLLVSGALNGDSTGDAFKFKTITGSAAPLPGTLALLGLGFATLIWNRRSIRARAVGAR